MSETTLETNRQNRALRTVKELEPTTDGEVGEMPSESESVGWLRRLSNAGVQHATDRRERRRIAVGNGLALILLVITLPYAVVLYMSGLGELGLLLVPFAALYLLPPWLNHRGHLRAARFSLLTIPAAIVLYYIFALGLPDEVMLFLPGACMPLVICDLRQKGLLAWGMLLPVTAAMLLVSAGESLVGPPRLGPEAVFSLHVAVVGGSFVILILIVFSFVVSEARAERSLEQAHREQEALQMELAQSQKLESVGRLAAGVAHEINTPIQYIGDSVNFVRDACADLRPLLGRYQALCRAAQNGAAGPQDIEGVLEAEQEADLEYVLENLPQALERALDGVSRVATIVRSMKEFAHPDQAEKMPADLNRALSSTVTVAGHSFKYVADVELRLAEIPPVPCFLGSLNQVFLNLIVNAGDAIAERVAGTEARGHIVVETRAEPNAVLVSVSDDGAGIPRAVEARIFEQFFTTKPVGKGTGQGLAIARRIIGNHGGQIWFESQEGKGTTFFVRLPIMVEQAPAGGRAPELVSPGSGPSADASV